MRSIHQKTRIASRLKLGASVGAIALLALPAVAQTAADDNLETVTVTGTLIKGIAPVGTNLVTFSADQIAATGAMTTNQVLANIPQVTNAFNSTAQSPIGATGGGYNPTIRNIAHAGGGTTTLTLVDSHNLVGVGGLQTAPDPGYIPTIALQRVDVVPDGGASLYGANAVTGVINFITRDSFEGFQTSVDAGWADSYSSVTAAAIGGHSWNTGSAYLSFQYSDNSYLMQGDRSYNRQNLTSIGGKDGRSTNCPLPNVSAGGVSYGLTALPSDTPGSLVAAASTTLNRCDTSPYLSMVPKEEQESFFGGFKQHLAEGVDFDMKYLWSSRQDTALQTSFTGNATIDASNPYFQQLGAATQQTVSFDFSPALGVHNYPTTARVEIFNVVPEVTTQLWGDWEAKLMGNYGRSALLGQGFALNNTYLTNASRVQAGGPTLTKTGAAANAFDPYDVALSNPSVTQGMITQGTLGKTQQEQEQLRLSADGTLFDLPGGAVKAVIGAQYGEEYYNGTWLTGPIGQQNPPAVAGGQFAIGRARRDITSVFGELLVPLVGEGNALPLVEKFTVDVSGRYDDYSDFGSTTNPKIGFTWDVIDELTVRGNMGTSFDAPSLADITAPDARIQYTTYAPGSPNTAVPAGTSATDALRPSILVPGGNPNLGPEKANTWSIGGEFHPHDMFGMDFSGLDVSVTRWHVGEHNQIGLAPYQAATISQGFAIPAYSKFYIFNPTIAQIQSYGITTLTGFPGAGLASAYAPGVATPYLLTDARRNNLGNEFLDGVDFHAAYTYDAGWGTVSGGFDGTYSLSNKIQGADGFALVSNQAYNTPLYQLSVHLGAIIGPLTTKLTLNDTPGYQLNPLTNISRTTYHQVNVGGFAPLNLFLSYDLNDLYSWTEGGAVSLTINNLLDSNPPILLGQGGASTSPNVNPYSSTLGRYFVLGFQKKF